MIQKGIEWCCVVETPVKAPSYSDLYLKQGNFYSDCVLFYFFAVNIATVMKDVDVTGSKFFWWENGFLFTNFCSSVIIIGIGAIGEIGVIEVPDTATGGRLHLITEDEAVVTSALDPAVIRHVSLSNK